MIVQDAWNLAWRLVREHLGNDWVVHVMRNTTVAGRCDYASNTIWLSLQYIKDSTEREVTDVIIHEIAHALVGPTNGHNTHWCRTARSLGGTGQKEVPGFGHDPLKILAVWSTLGVWLLVTHPPVAIAYGGLTALYGLVQLIAGKTSPERVYKLRPPVV